MGTEQDNLMKEFYEDSKKQFSGFRDNISKYMEEIINKIDEQAVCEKKRKKHL